jgi:hypothetical protein
MTILQKHKWKVFTRTIFFNFFSKRRLVFIKTTKYHYTLLLKSHHESRDHDEAKPQLVVNSESNPLSSEKKSSPQSTQSKNDWRSNKFILSRYSMGDWVNLTEPK